MHCRTLLSIVDKERNVGPIIWRWTISSKKQSGSSLEHKLRCRQQDANATKQKQEIKLTNVQSIHEQQKRETTKIYQEILIKAKYTIVELSREGKKERPGQTEDFSVQQWFPRPWDPQWTDSMKLSQRLYWSWKETDTTMEAKATLEKPAMHYPTP